MEKTKKIFSVLLLCCVICLSFFAFNIKKMAVSAYSGTEYIYDAAGLALFAKNVNTGAGSGKYANYQVYLMNSINMQGVDFQGIGNSSYYFTGIFYGQGNTIYNLSCSWNNG